MQKFGTPTIALPFAIKKCTVQTGCTVCIYLINVFIYFLIYVFMYYLIVLNIIMCLLFLTLNCYLIR